MFSILYLSHHRHFIFPRNFYKSRWNEEFKKANINLSIIFFVNYTWNNLKVHPFVQWQFVKNLFKSKKYKNNLVIEKIDYAIIRTRNEHLNLYKHMWKYLYFKKCTLLSKNDQFTFYNVIFLTSFIFFYSIINIYVLST